MYLSKIVFIFFVILLSCNILSSGDLGNMDRFMEINIDSDYSMLSPDIQEAIPFLIEAMKGIDDIYVMQMDEKLPEYMDKVMSGNDNKLKEYVNFFKGPWDHNNHYKSVTNDMPDRNPGCAFYPDDIIKEEFDNFLSQLSKKDKNKFLDEYTVIRRDRTSGKNSFIAIPYHKFYKKKLDGIYKNIMKASGFIKNKNLRNYLELKAKSLIDGTYRKADSAWVKLKDTEIEFVIGPYEVYEDSLYGVKAAYESMLLIKDKEKTDLLRNIESNIHEIAKIFPLPKGTKLSIGRFAPVVVADQIYSSGEAYSGVFSIAFNLPNDEWVRSNVGWKQVLIHNLAGAKFENISLKIAERVLADNSRISMEPFLYFILFHEISHSLGPSYTRDGRRITKALEENYSDIEECKADIGSVYLLQKLNGSFGIPVFTKKQMLTGFLAGLFRSMRFGYNEAHGKANLIQYNWFVENKVISYDNGKYKYDVDKFENTTLKLLEKVTELEASADKKQINDFISKYTVISDDLENVMRSLTDIPSDIMVKYSIN